VVTVTAHSAGLDDAQSAVLEVVVCDRGLVVRDHGAAEAHGVSAANAAGGGAVFTLRLPAG
jgi:hypothetical protein